MESSHVTRWAACLDEVCWLPTQGPGESTTGSSISPCAAVMVLRLVSSACCSCCARECWVPATVRSLPQVSMATTQAGKDRMLLGSRAMPCHAARDRARPWSLSCGEKLRGSSIADSNAQTLPPHVLHITTHSSERRDSVSYRSGRMLKSAQSSISPT